jgi:hypothetical protein
LDERNNIVVGPNAECGGAALGGETLKVSLNAQ